MALQSVLTPLINDRWFPIEDERKLHIEMLSNDILFVKVNYKDVLKIVLCTKE